MSVQNSIWAVIGAGATAILLFGASVFNVDVSMSPAASPTPTLSPFGQSPSVAACHDGWDDTSTGDLHIVTLSCGKYIDGILWTVFRNPDGSFNYGWDGIGPYEYNEEAVPQW